MKKSAMFRLAPEKLAEFDRMVEEYASRLSYSSNLHAIWPEWQDYALNLRDNGIKGACKFLLEYLKVVTDSEQFKKLPPESRRLVLRLFARVEERLGMLMHS